ncbi:uncharacterized protein FOMMEDRAFT_105434 [Fomitiporia mediterranea MF3/22]|uniref:uncharacterized protein n=1 Tax=Fomitiporia mediterranea (strain MF3/22) TaxID=694068 RepID=UPI00044084B6|nr:uncharacterized protein FOMMEDRAFT_105434 [Fomitiporia mediterranea MF3/22]EJD05207.1 hypothetical protein FOMMEDRAFT_105434 [Fomitiporia mediterranea MF3/22]
MKSSLDWLIVLLAFVQLVFAHDNGMDMSMDGAMSLSAGNMLSYLHFTPGDVVWFQGWVPRSTRTMVGACIGLFLLAIFERWLAAFRGLSEAHWLKHAQMEASNKPNTTQRRSLLSILSQVPVYDMPRGVVHAAQSALEIAFMLIVMSYQVGFIIALVAGLGVGEALFGRFNVHAHLL